MELILCTRCGVELSVKEIYQSYGSNLCFACERNIYDKKEVNREDHYLEDLIDNYEG